MRGTARIIYDGGMLMMPARTPYDLEEVFEALDWYSVHHTGVTFRLNGSDWRIGTVPHQPDAECGCEASTGSRGAKPRSQRTLCRRCMREVVMGRRGTVPAGRRRLAAAGE